MRHRLPHQRCSNTESSSETKNVGNQVPPPACGKVLGAHLENLNLNIQSKRISPLLALAKAPDDALVLHEIYASIQGESSYAGLPCTFIRTTACHLRCHYCDTSQAFTKGRLWRRDEIMTQVAHHGLSLVELTGGEPLLQPGVYPLMTTLCDAGYTVLLETSGSLDISRVDGRVRRIVDFKAPSSGAHAANLMRNIDYLRDTDEVKLVLGNREDYEWARALIETEKLHKRCAVLFGAVYDALETATLVAWIVEDKIPVRLNTQIHKAIWTPDARGV